MKKTKKKAKKEIEEEYEVEAIVDKRILKGKPEYKVKWKGYSPSVNSWEPLVNLEGCVDLITRFENKLADTEESTPTRTNSKRPYSSDSDASLSPELNSKSAAVASLKQSKRTNMAAWKELLKHAKGPPILVTNNVDNEGPPSDLKYIDKSIYGPGVPKFDPEFLVSCECKFGEENSCFTNGNNCICGEGSHGLLAYDENGRVRFPPNYSAIWECNDHCSCASTPESFAACRNRVVQKGPTIHFEIFKTSNGRGWGVKARQFVQKGTFIASYVGEIIRTTEADNRGVIYDFIKRTYLFDLDYFEQILEEDENFVGKQNAQGGSSTTTPSKSIRTSVPNTPACPADQRFTIDGYHYCNISHFINHSCDANLGVYTVFIDNQDPRIHELALFALSDIHANEELTFNYYGENLKKKKSVKRQTSIPCKCGSLNCRKWLC